MDAKQKAGFSHITVGADDEDEVIVAGVTDPVEAAPELEPDDEPALEPEPEAEPEPTPEPQTAQSPRPAAPKDEYRETTLEDLEAAPMPLIQKIVLVCAVVLIIVCVAYYFGVVAH